MTTVRPFDVFVSYSSEDRELARQLATWLRKVRCTPWLDEEQIVPGSRWRAALQQGIRDSTHLLAVLTPAYVSRPWTQRELDLFDLAAGHEERRVLAIQTADIPVSALDQIFEVSHRIPWRHVPFDGSGFWRLYCGLRNQPPGPSEVWSQKAASLLAEPQTAQSQPSEVTPLQYFSTLEPSIGWSADLLRVAFDACYGNQSTLRAPLNEARRMLPEAQRTDLLSVVRSLWAHGFAEPAALLAVAALPKTHVERSSWPFLDLNCTAVSDSILLPGSLAGSHHAEIWFAWGVCTSNWSALPRLAELAPLYIRQHMTRLAAAAASRSVTFSEFESEFDFGTMISPWNHFQLSWLALRLGNIAAASAHAEKLCTSSAYGERRTGRFLNRLLHWPVFDPLRASIAPLLEVARRRLHLTTTEQSQRNRRMLLDAWAAEQ